MHMLYQHYLSKVIKKYRLYILGNASRNPMIFASRDSYNQYNTSLTWFNNRIHAHPFSAGKSPRTHIILNTCIMNNSSWRSFYL
jgi:hypothetical protein